VLIAGQCGLVLGLLLCTSVPIDDSAAEIWVLAADAPSLQQAYPIPEWWQLRLAEQPEIVRTECYLLGDGSWHKPNRGSSELCFIVGTRLDDDSLGALRSMSAEVRQALTEPGTVVVDDWELSNLGVQRGRGEIAELNGRRVKIVGTVHGFQGHNFIYSFCSMQTARQLLPSFAADPGMTICVLGRCRQPQDVGVVIDRLRRCYPDMGVYSRDELSRQARLYWLFRSTGGTVLVCTIALALLVGLVVTSQTLYAAGLAALREYAVLDALGIPRARMVKLVLAKSFWIGIGGVLLALPVVFLLSWAALLIPARIILPFDVLAITGVLTLGNALLSGLSALRPLRKIEPAVLLR
jgi:putative ABC transport system permease protein